MKKVEKDLARPIYFCDRFRQIWSNSKTGRSIFDLFMSRRQFREEALPIFFQKKVDCQMHKHQV
jgi:hypothetical protein